MDHHDAASSAAAAGVVGVVIVVYILFLMAIVAFSIWMQWRILVKAGFNGALSLLLLTGIGGLIIQIILAFTTWPRDRAALPSSGGYGGPPATV